MTIVFDSVTVDPMTVIAGGDVAIAVGIYERGVYPAEDIYPDEALYPGVDWYPYEVD